MLKIAITGPESTGKSTLTEDLAKHFNCVFIPEFAREYLQKKNGEYHQLDLNAIAFEQNKQINSATHDQLILADTEMTVMKIWSEFKYGNCSPEILKLYQDQNFDFYILCDIDIPWQEDPLREHPEKRKELFDLYFNEISKKPHLILSGSHENRLKKGIKVINKLLLNS